MKGYIKTLSKIFFLFITSSLFAYSPNYIIVAQDGSGDFKTITEAIESLPMFNYQRIVIHIKNGIYNEKFRIEKDNVTFRGENKENTIIRYSQLREDWIKNQDPVGPAVVNIHADDIVMENVTIENSQPEIGPHAFAVYGTGTRTILLNCKLLSKGGDAVSLWNYKSGMYYHSNCYFEGAVDMVCPRGWCFIKNSKFYEIKKTTSIWHAGGYDINQKLVIKNSSFDGINDFELGRHHYEAQFYLIDCWFSKKMADKPIYRVTYEDSTRNRPFNWGVRNYYLNCSVENKKFNWLSDSLSAAKDSLQSEKFTASWTFDGNWDPERKQGPVVIKYETNGTNLYLFFDEAVTVIGNPKLRSLNGRQFEFHSGGEHNTIRFTSDKVIEKNDLQGLVITNNAKIIGTTASVHERSADLIINDIQR